MRRIFIALGTTAALALAVPAVALGVAWQSLPEERTPLRASLSDGQVILGGIHTETLLLEGGAGTLAVPLDDIGEIVPVEGQTLTGSGDHVTVWLRNGSELKGRWADPNVRIGVDAGGEEVLVDVPMDRLTRLQLEGGQWWAPDDAYRTRTTWGDDFFVDADATRLVVVNDLGRFAPSLSECARAEPVGDPTGDWRVELRSGTVIIGALEGESLSFALSEGPERMEVPLEHLVSLAPAGFDPAPSRPSLGGMGSGSGRWFDRTPQESYKRSKL